MNTVDALKMMKILATAERDATKILDVLVTRIVPRIHDATSTQHLHARANVVVEILVNWERSVKKRQLANQDASSSNNKVSYLIIKPVRQE